MSLAQRMANASYRFYDAIRHPQAGKSDETVAGFDHLRGHRYAVLTTYRRDGEPVPTPVWFGVGPDGRFYCRTDATSAKVRRVGADPRATVMPSTMRGKPKGAAAEGSARIVSADEEKRAEAAIQANYGLARRLYERSAGDMVDAVYLEVTPA